VRRYRMFLCVGKKDRYGPLQLWVMPFPHPLGIQLNLDIGSDSLVPGSEWPAAS